MALTLPVTEQIDLSMLAVVGAVSVANGYQITLRQVVRWDPDNIPSAQDLTAIVSWEGDEPFVDNDTPADHTPIGDQQYTRHFSINVYLLKAPQDGVGLPTWRNIVRADVEKAVLADRQRGGHAIDTYSRGLSLFQDANDLTGITVHFAVVYRTLENNPYQQG